jgi:hypothetical protein
LGDSSKKCVPWFSEPVQPFVAIKLQLALTLLELFGTLAARLHTKMFRKFQSHLSPTARFNISLALTLVLILSISIPFGQALEIHHLFADVDHDGHQHSDFDLCQWMQHHTANSLIWDVPRLSHWSAVTDFLPHDSEETYVSLILPLWIARGPPGLWFS